MRLIDADALRADAITRSGSTEVAFDNCYPFWQFSQAIAQAPTIEAATVVHGRWKQRGKNLGECSECGEVVLVRYRYCPDCGARMDGGGNA